MLRITFSKFFVFLNLLAVVLISPLSIIILKDDIPLYPYFMIKHELAAEAMAYYKENLLTCIAECIPLYLIALILILLFFMYRPKECSVFILPLAYLLLIPLYIVVLFIFGPLMNSRTIDIETWSVFLMMRVVPFYAVPLICITSGIAFYLKKRLEKVSAGSLPFLLRLRTCTLGKKRKIMLMCLIAMASLLIILFIVSFGRG